MHNQSHHNYPDNTVLLVLSSLFKTMSLTLTGNELGTSTATISRALSTAREFFADELFVRSGPRMVPTARMRELLPDINDVLRRLEKLSAPTVFDPAELSRTFRIAAADNGVLAFLFPAFKRILKQAPQVKLDVIGLNGDLFEDLRNGRLDLAMFPFDPIPPNAAALYLLTNPMCYSLKKDILWSPSTRKRENCRYLISRPIQKSKSATSRTISRQLSCVTMPASWHMKAMERASRCPTFWQPPGWFWKPKPP